MLRRRHPGLHFLRDVARNCGAIALAVLVVLNGKTGAVAGEGTAAPDAEVRDVIVMLDDGPFHCLVHVSIGGQSPEQARRSAVDRLFKTLDLDGDGKLSHEESQKSPLFREKQRPGAAQFLKSIGAELTTSRRDVEQRIERFGGETVVYRQNTSTSDTDSLVFALLDSDNSGVVTEAELFNAVDLLLSKDADDDECVMLDEISPPPVVDPLQPGLVALAAPPKPPSAEIIHDTRQALLPAKLMRKYDKDATKSLSAAELGWTAERLRAVDLDGNGTLDLRELGGLARSAVDVELSVDVVRGTGRSMLRVLSCRGERIDDDRYPDLATIRTPTAILTFSTREVDPFEVSMTIAMRTFNSLDLDGNGYLDRDETREQERFGRGLFDQIDSDGDEKIFGEEMKEFIRVRGEPIATTCQVTAFDDGAGFFSTLDSNGDRRISLREMRYADQTFARMERDGKPGISKTEPVRRYRFEFVRGVFNPFGTQETTGGMVATDAAAKPRPVGPVWFQRWDRNGDGDLTWREFLGPRDVFERLDVDRDGLLDPREAEAAGKWPMTPERREATAASNP